jgi:hypothetical protein
MQPKCTNFTNQNSTIPANSVDCIADRFFKYKTTKQTTTTTKIVGNNEHESNTKYKNAVIIEKENGQQRISFNYVDFYEF